MEEFPAWKGKAFSLSLEDPQGKIASAILNSRSMTGRALLPGCIAAITEQVSDFPEEQTIIELKMLIEETFRKLEFLKVP
ncbi:MAG: hypothetical protein ACLFR7_09760 [Opitutales bacterium]